MAPVARRSAWRTALQDGSLPEPERPVAVPVAVRAWMIALGFLPVLHALSVAAAALWFPGPGSLRACVALAALYLLPPLAARASALLLPVPRGYVGLDETRFLGWWLASQWQVIFNRLRLLEEALQIGRASCRERV